MLSSLYKAGVGRFTRGSQTIEMFATSIVTFETGVANFENDIASAKWL